MEKCISKYDIIRIVSVNALPGSFPVDMVKAEFSKKEAHPSRSVSRE